jgi:HEAT repeat protein
MPENQEDRYDRLARALYDSDQQKAIEAAKELLASDEESVEYLTTELTALKKPTRDRISEIVRNRYSFDELKKWAEEDKSEGVLLLGISQYPGAFDILIKMLTQKLLPHTPTLEELRVWDVIEAFGLLGDKRAMPKLQELEADGLSKYKDIDIRKSAKIAIKNIGS